MAVVIAILLLLAGLWILIDLIIHTVWLALIAVFLGGILVGRVYAGMKGRYPENEEVVRTKVSKARADRLRAEIEEERLRVKLDAELDKRIRHGD